MFIFISGIERHRGRIVYLTYEPSAGHVNKTLFLVGKGVTYDTGGADIKAGGVMAGMSRDKCGAAAVAGFMKVCSKVLTYQHYITYQ
jgi:leucyl aminopeptidase